MQPVIAGIDDKNVPYIGGMDSIGALSRSKDFIVSGTATDMLFGTCESFWKPDMEPEDLFEAISQVC